MPLDRQAEALLKMTAHQRAVPNHTKTAQQARADALERAVAMFAPLIEQMSQRSEDSVLRRWSEPGALN